MNHKVLTKFVVEGMKKNKKTLVPFLIAASVTVMIYYILHSLAFSPYIYYEGKEVFYGAQTLAILLEMSAGIVSIFATIFLFYANQFVMRERKKEIALYGILGLSKKHITYIMFLEIVIKSVICIGTGILTGTFLNKLMLLTLYKIIGREPVSGILFTPESLIATLRLFLIIFVVCLIYNVFSVNVAHPIELLQSNKAGEKEPKVKVLMLIVGVTAIVSGYYAALQCKSTTDAYRYMFTSIVLVIIGTYFLFITGSIFILKILKRNKKFYYKTKNFISVSNLMYRMKHNAAGLASICVLSTGVILLMTCASSLMMLGEENINRIFQNDIKFTAIDNREETEEEYYMDAIEQAAEQEGIFAENFRFFKYRRSSWEKTDAGFKAMDRMSLDVNSIANVYIMTAEDYNHYADTVYEVSADEVLIYSSNGEGREELDILGRTFQVKGSVDYDRISAYVDASMSLYETYVVVFGDEDIVKDVLGTDSMIKNADRYNIYVGCDTEDILTEEQINALKVQVDETIGNELRGIYDGGYAELEFKQVERSFFYNMYGGAFFVGCFLAVLFLMATVMIIYYKQMSEGFEDQKRYQILSYVGLSQQEIKATIQRQIMILFFLPVVTAILHMLAASNLIRLFLRMVLVVDAFTFNLCILAVSCVFVVVYIIVYKITSVQYYKIVNVLYAP